MTVLVLGGAGYIGSHMVAYLQQQHIGCVVVDNLATGFRESVPANVPFYEGDLADKTLLADVFNKHDVSAVMHFAAFSQVGESVVEPQKYYQNNLQNTLSVLQVMQEHGVEQFVFSSTAAVYGQPQSELIDEQHPANPINPYGRSKLAVEWVLQDYAQAYGLKSVCLRYFNAAGAQPEGNNGERHDPETHLVPLVLQAASGRRKAISVFGDDYATADGTCIRDYIHIVDLAQAHLLALNWLQKQPGGVYKVFNLGNGNGYSVRQVIDAVKTVTGNAFKVVQAARRAGDPGVLVASADLARKELGWDPQFTDLEEIISHAWQWEKQHGHLWGTK